MREHLFITTEHFENCHIFQIFGVSKASINQFGLVNPGDTVFFLNRKDNLFIGPYKVVSDIFYNEEIIWDKSNREKGIDAYPYRVRLKSDIIYAIDGNILSKVIEKKMRIDSGDLRGRSVFTLFPKDSGILEPILKKEGKELKKAIVNKEITGEDITIELAEQKDFYESFLEFFLLKNFTDFFDSNLLPYNQFRTNLLDSRIDIIALTEKKILVLELKRKKIEEKDVQQLQTYISWVKNNTKLLEKIFKTKLNKADIQSFIIGKDVDNDFSTDYPIKKYTLKEDKLILSDL